MKEKIRVIFRADGNTHIGLGHLVRCSALADAIGNEWEKILYTQCSIKDLLNSIKNNYSQIVNLPNTEEYQNEADKLSENVNPTDIVVLDGYNFDESYQKAISKTGATLVCIDDIHDYFFRSAVIINSAGGISSSDYQALPGTQFFLGPQYTLLRKPFLEKASARQDKIGNKKIFICLGGADPENKTLEVLHYIIPVKRFDSFCIVTGAGYLYREELESYISENKIDAEVYNAISAEEMADLMAECSYAICSPSTVSYEYLTVGGVLYLFQIAENQTDMINNLTSQGYAFLLNDIINNSEEVEQKSLVKQSEVFDGKAGERLKQIFSKISIAQEITIRKANEDDSSIFFEWANDKVVREQSYNRNEVLLPEHNSWFKGKLNDKNSFIYVLEFNNKPVAQIRFQVTENEAVLGYLLDKSFRNTGMGTTVLSKGIEAFTRDINAPLTITGFVKFSNIASQRSFEKLKFVKEEAKEYVASFKYTMRYEGN